MAKRYRYFVAFFYNGKSGRVGVGSLAINLVERLDTNEALGTLERELSEHYGYKNCTLINFVLLGEEEVDHENRI